MIAITVSDATRHSAERAAAQLTLFGHAVQMFAADGVGGPAMEGMIRAGLISGVLDLALDELITHCRDVAPDRLTAAAIAGIPQMISLGGLDAEPERLDAIGKEIAEKASAARGPTRIFVAMKEPATPLVQSLRNWIYPPELLIELELAINDDEYIDTMVKELNSQIK